MKIPNLQELLISISDFKTQLSDIITGKKIKVIVKNSEPMSVVMPYEDYIAINQSIEEHQNALKELGQDITLSNGVTLMVCVDNSSSDEIAIRTYVKMKTSGDYKLHYTLRLSPPSVAETLTLEEMMQHYQK